MPKYVLHPKPAIGAAPPVDDPLSGIVLAVLAGIVFSISDATAKYMAPGLPILEIVWLRWFGFLAIVLPTIAYSRGRVLRSRAPALQTFRAMCLVGSSGLFIAGLSLLPLATATTLNFVAPLIVTALSIPLLGEKVGARRWAAIGVGLLGVVVIVRPGTSAFELASFLPMASAASWALGVIATRKLAGVDPPWTAMCYSAVIGFLVLSVAVVPVLVMPTGTQIALAAVLAVAATVGQYMTVLAFGRAPASLLAPFSYVQLLWSTLLGYLLFANLPDGWTAFGAAIIIASGLYTAHRERIRARDARLQALDARTRARDAPAAAG